MSDNIGLIGCGAVGSYVGAYLTQSGENITLIDLTYDTIKPKQQYKIGTPTIEISLICYPCATLQVLSYVQKTNLKDFIKTLLKRRGWYAKIIEPGHIHIGDPVEILF